MSIHSDSAVDDEGHPEQLQNQPPAFHPSAPPDELFNISTTVDPSYIISLIRKLLSSGIISTRISSEGAKDEVIEQSVLLLASENNNSLYSQYEAMDTVDHYSEIEVQDAAGSNSVREKVWEEYGCILWDLAGCRTHAELMVQNLVLEVLLATLVVNQSARVTEICLGIIGNLACYEVSRKKIATTKGLVEVIVDQLFLDDTRCLCEAFRLLTLCVQGGEALTWAEALQHENLLSRILWISENTLNIHLIEKSVGLLLAILESQQEVNSVVLPSLVKMGLPTLLINLFTFEMTKLTAGPESERYSVLDIILRTIEALSVIDGYSQELCSSKILFQLLKELVKLPDNKIEYANSCVTAAVLTANILSDDDDLALELSQDLMYLQGLLDIYPFASDDKEARSAMWSIFGSLLIRVEENETSLSNLNQYVKILISKSDLIEEELIDDQYDESLNACGPKLTARTIALKRISCILRKWTELKDQNKETTFTIENHFDEEIDAGRLLECCSKYTKYNSEFKA